MLGLIREIVAANYFGARGPINAFTVAFQIPNLVRALVADAALSSAFVPVFSELLEKGEKARAWRVASTVFWLFLLGLGALTALFILAAPVLIPPLNGAYDDLAVTLSQILFPIVVLLGLFGIVTGILNSYEQFTIPALTPVFWNLAIIIGLVLGVPRADTENGKLYVYAGSIVIGTVIQFLLPLPWLRGLDGRLRLALDFRDPAVKQVFKLMLPVMLGLGLINVNAVIGTVFASKLIDPTSRRPRSTRHSAIYMLPQGMFSVAVATVLFPSLARLATRGDLAGFRDTVSHRAAADQLPARPSRRRLRRPRRADRPPALPARRLRARPDARRRRCARGLLARAHVQRDDADAQPRLLQPAGAVDADPRSRSPTLVLNTALYAVFYRVGTWGIPLRDLAREHRRRRAPAHRAAPPRRPARPPPTARSFVLVTIAVGRARRRRATASGTSSTSALGRSFPAQLVSLGAALLAGGVVYLAAAACFGFASSRRYYRCETASAGADHAWTRTHIRNFSIIAHIDHGKSTLADRILELTDTVSDREMREQLLDSMELERERGITIKAQAVRVRWKGHQLNLIDTPGHVDFTYEVSRSLQACEGALLVVDAAQGIEAQTLANAYLAIENNLEIVPVVNKIDLPQADPDGAAAEVADLIGDDPERVLRISAKTGQGVEDVLDAIVERIPAPAGDPDAPARALIFDSSYDQYRGVVAFVRVVDGRFETREPLRAMAQGTRFEAEELGFFSPDAPPGQDARRPARSAT